MTLTSYILSNKLKLLVDCFTSQLHFGAAFEFESRRSTAVFIRIKHALLYQESKDVWIPFRASGGEYLLNSRQAQNTEKALVQAQWLCTHSGH